MAAGDTTITMIGNLVDDPELRFTPSGAAVAKFRVASTPRYLDKQTNEWKDGESLFLQCQIWRQAAENVAESLTKGMRVILSGRLKQRKAQRSAGGAGGYSAPAAADSFNEDPWAAASSSAPAGGGWGTSTTDEPPF